MPFICDIFWQHKRRYGARRVAVEMQAIGRPCGVDRVAKLLKSQGLQAIQPQSFRPPTTDSRHALGDICCHSMPSHNRDAVNAARRAG
jgi:hypothetical protein